MAEKVACPKCGESNYPTDRQCLSCGASLVPDPALSASTPPVAPGATGPTVTLPPRTLSGDDRSWWRRHTDDVIEYQLGALIGLAAVVLGLAGVAALIVGPTAGWSAASSVAFSVVFFLGIAAYCFIWYTRDPDSLWPLIICIVVSGLIWWIVIGLCAFVGAAIEKKMQKE